MDGQPCQIDFVDGAPQARCITHDKVLEREPFSGVLLSSRLEVEQFVCPVGGVQVIVPKVTKSK
jgi:hypothetical protein